MEKYEEESYVLDTLIEIQETILGKPIYWTGTDWVDSTGTPV